MLRHLFRCLVVVALCSVAFCEEKSATDVSVAERPNMYRHRWVPGTVKLLWDETLDSAAKELCVEFANSGTPPTNGMALTKFVELGGTSVNMIGYYPKASWFTSAVAVGDAAARVNGMTAQKQKVFCRTVIYGSHVEIRGDKSYWVVLFSE